MKITKIDFKDMAQMRKMQTKSVICERYKLFKRAQESGEVLEAVYAAMNT